MFLFLFFFQNKKYASILDIDEGQQLKHARRIYPKSRGHGKSTDQQGSFIQCACSEVSTFECVYRIDIPMDKCGHHDLTAVQFEDGLDGGTFFDEILRNPTLDFRTVTSKLSSSIRSSQLRGVGHGSGIVRPHNSMPKFLKVDDRPEAFLQ